MNRYASRQTQSALRPQSNAESKLEPSDSHRFNPGSSLENFADDAVVDAGESANFAQAPASNRNAEVERDLAHDLGSVVAADFTIPVLGEIAGRVAAGTGHIETLPSSSLENTTCESLGLELWSTPGVSYSQSEKDELTVAKKIDSFVPKIASDDWAVIGDFVREVVRDAEPDRYETAGSWLSLVAALTLWSWKVECLDLERDVILEPANIFAYIEQRDAKNDKAQATARSILLRISARVIGPNAGATEDRRTYRKDTGRTPYTSAEKIGLRSYMNGQATEHRRRNVRVIVALGAGAGLTAVDLMQIYPGHVVDDGDKILVNVPGKRARTVPLIADWDDLLREALAEAEPGMPFVLSTRGKFRYGNAIADFLYTCNGEGTRPHCQRLRSTWFVDHLNARTPIKVLLAAAGVTEVSTLQRYLKFVAPVDADVAQTLLRLEEKS